MKKERAADPPADLSAAAVLVDPATTLEALPCFVDGDLAQGKVVDLHPVLLDPSGCRASDFAHKRFRLGEILQAIIHALRTVTDKYMFRARAAEVERGVSEKSNRPTGVRRHTSLHPSGPCPKHVVIRDGFRRVHDGLQHPLKRKRLSAKSDARNPAGSRSTRCRLTTFP